ncbi:MAG: DUF4349 domain-containing protein [Chitinispirillales bacterium]|jgi:hypothetical protein|nr:DUF4349 domain-containing protein [Chitinispirillales bacterium]
MNNACVKRAVRPIVIFATLSLSVSLPAALSSCASSKSEMAPSYGMARSNEYSPRGSEETGGRMVAYSMSLSLIVKHEEETSKILHQSVKSCNGFIVQESKNYITARIPQDNADRFINTSKALGKTAHESKTGTDITDQYNDNVIRLDNLKTVRDRYLALLEKADSVGEILNIEKELERIVLEIERLEGRVKSAEKSVAYSIVSVGFREKTKPGPVGWVFYGLYHGVKWLFVW